MVAKFAKRPAAIAMTAAEKKIETASTSTDFLPLAGGVAWLSDA